MLLLSQPVPPAPLPLPPLLPVRSDGGYLQAQEHSGDHLLFIGHQKAQCRGSPPGNHVSNAGCRCRRSGWGTSTTMPGGRGTATRRRTLSRAMASALAPGPRSSAAPRTASRCNGPAPCKMRSFTSVVASTGKTFAQQLLVSHSGSVSWGLLKCRPYPSRNTVVQMRHQPVLGVLLTGVGQHAKSPDIGAEAVTEASAGRQDCVLGGDRPTRMWTWWSTWTRCGRCWRTACLWFSPERASRMPHCRGRRLDAAALGSALGIVLGRTAALASLGTLQAFGLSIPGYTPWPWGASDGFAGR